MSEQTWALLDADGVVANVIVADEEFIASLDDLIDDPDTDTGDLAKGKRYRVDDLDEPVSVGWKRSRNGRWVAPVPPEPTEEELAARAAAEQRAADDAWLADALGKVRGGGKLTQDERDRLALIQASRA